MANSDRLTLMAVHAHPDDESSSTGGVLARSSAEGCRTVVVTCTNGEYGDGPEHVKPGQPGHDPEEVARTRLGELEVACERLGVTHVELLGYHDSGMADWDFKDRSDVFCNVPIEDSAKRLEGIFEQYQPDVVVTYADAGGYNHPDHRQAHLITLHAVERTGIPAKLYLIARRRQDWQKIREHLAGAGMEVPSVPQWQTDPERLRAMEMLEDRITTTVAVTPWADHKRAALAAHASQLDESFFLRLPTAVFADVFGAETFIRSMDRTGAATPRTTCSRGSADRRRFVQTVQA